MMQTKLLQEPIVLILTNERLREATAELVERTRSVPTDTLGHLAADLFHEPVTWEDAEWQ